MSSSSTTGSQSQSREHQQNSVVTAANRRAPIDRGQQSVQGFGRNGARDRGHRPVGDRGDSGGQVTGDVSTIACIMQEGSQGGGQEFGALQMQAWGLALDKSHNIPGTQ